MNRRHKRPPLDYIIVFGLLLGMLWFSYLLFTIIPREEVARKAARDAKNELQALEEREATLQANINDLETERGKEASIRETYGVAKPDEEVIILVPDSNDSSLNELSWWGKLMAKIGL